MTSTNSGSDVERTASGLMARSTVTVCAALQVFGAVTLAMVGAVSGNDPLYDWLRPIAIAVVYGLPGIMALVALRGRASLLLTAGVASLGLAVFPLSVQTVVLGPAGLVYLLVHLRWPRARQGGARSAGAALIVVLLLSGGVVALVVHDDPVCYTRDADGDVTIDRNPDPDQIDGQVIGGSTGVVEAGCSSDTVVWWEATISLALSALAFSTAVHLVRRH